MRTVYHSYDIMSNIFDIRYCRNKVLPVVIDDHEFEIIQSGIAVCMGLIGMEADAVAGFQGVSAILQGDLKASVDDDEIFIGALVVAVRNMGGSRLHGHGKQFKISALGIVVVAAQRAFTVVQLLDRQIGQ